MIRILHQGEKILLIVLLSALTMLMFSDAIMRFMGIGALWLEDTIKWVSAWFVLLGMSYGVRTNAHIGLTILTSKITNQIVKRIVETVSLLICLIYSLIFLLSSYRYVSLQKTFGFELDDLPVPEWVPYSGLLLGFSLLMLRFAVLFFAVVIGKHDGVIYVDDAHESVSNLAKIK